MDFERAAWACNASTTTRFRTVLSFRTHHSGLARRFLMRRLCVIALCAVAAAFMRRAAACAAGRHLHARRRSDPACRCVACHRAGEVAPMALLTYRGRAAVGAGDQGQSRRPADAAVVRRSAVGAFANDPRLSAEDIATISRWVDAGAPQGDPKDMPDAAHVHGGLAAGRARHDHRAAGSADSGDGRRFLSNAKPDAGPERRSLDSRRRDPSEQSCQSRITR